MALPGRPVRLAQNLCKLTVLLKPCPGRHHFALHHAAMLASVLQAQQPGRSDLPQAVLQKVCKAAVPLAVLHATSLDDCVSLPGHPTGDCIDRAICVQPVCVADQQIGGLIPPSARQLPWVAMLHTADILSPHLVPLPAGGQEAAGIEVHIIIHLQHPVAHNTYHLCRSLRC